MRETIDCSSKSSTPIEAHQHGSFWLLKSLVWLMQCGVLCHKPSLQGKWRGLLGELHGSWHKVGVYISGEAQFHSNYFSDPETNLKLMTCWQNQDEACCHQASGLT